MPGRILAFLPASSLSVLPAVSILVSAGLDARAWGTIHGARGVAPLAVVRHFCPGCVDEVGEAACGVKVIALDGSVEP